MITISKEKFEASVSVALSADAEIFEKLTPAIERSTLELETKILGEPGTVEIDRNPRSLLAYDASTYICVDAFLNNFRQLDLVLTPTGFGVVSNNTITPASRARVDALEISLRLIHAKAYGAMLDELVKVPGWGDTTQAAENIRTPFYSIRFVAPFPSEEDLKVYEKMQPAITEADLKIRQCISDEQMDDILSQLRNGTDDMAVCDVCRLITEVYRMHYYNSPVIDDKMRFLLQTLESNAETFSIYIKSSEYQARHADTFENKKESSAYIFVG